MAWIKVEHGTPDKPEIIRLADALGIDQDAAFGKCIRFWIWADQQSIDGNALSVTTAFLDRLTNCPGFSAGLITVGWLESRNGRFSIPNFDRQNGQTAKARALTSDRVKRSRNGPRVTGPLPEEEEELLSAQLVSKKDKPTRGFRPPTLEEVAEHCRERNNGIDPEAFMAHYNANGWVQGRGKPVINWKACIITWERRDAKEKKKKGSRVMTPEEGANWNPTDGGLNDC